MRLTGQTRRIVWQLIVLALLSAALASVVAQTALNLRQRGIASRFDYLSRPAGFEIAPGSIAYSSRDSYARALALGLANTLQVAWLAAATATVLGALIGMARLSRVRMVFVIANAYVEVMRNTPLVLQLLFWYAVSQSLPTPDRALRLMPDVFLCVRGLFFPTLHLFEGHLVIERPALAGFTFHGGTSISPESGVLFIGLATSTAAFIGEIVRGGVLAVDNGQTEAALALGLSRARLLRLVVLPQALRVIVPPPTSHYLNLLKNSSLAVAIGYPDLMSITTSTLNQTGQAVEAIAVAMVVYLSIGLAISFAMNLYNRSVAWPGAQSVM